MTWLMYAILGAPSCVHTFTAPCSDVLSLQHAAMGLGTPAKALIMLEIKLVCQPASLSSPWLIRVGEMRACAAGGATVVKVFLYLLCKALAARSSSAMALAEDHRNDILSNTVAIATAAIASNYRWRGLLGNNVQILARTSLLLLNSLKDV